MKKIIILLITMFMCTGLFGCAKVEDEEAIKLELETNTCWGVFEESDVITEIEIISSAVKEILDMAVKAFIDDDTAIAECIEPLEEVIDNLKAKLKDNHIDRVKKSEYTIEVGFVFSDIITDLERVADHCSNIAACIIQIAQDSFDMHRYLSSIKRYEENSFKEQIEMYSEKYKV